MTEITKIIRDAVIAEIAVEAARNFEDEDGYKSSPRLELKAADLAWGRVDEFISDLAFRRGIML